MAHANADPYGGCPAACHDRRVGSIIVDGYGIVAGPTARFRVLLARWVGWLVFGGLMHLALTLLGGRGVTGTTIGMVAWANPPFAVREMVRGLYMLVENQTIQATGLAGFAEPGGIVSACLGLVDLYVVWNILLLFIGVHTGYGDVLSIFLGEAAGIGFIGGMGGIVIGWIASRVVNVLALAYLVAQATEGGGPPPSVAIYTPVWLLAFTLVFATFIGLVSGLYPALRAATLVSVTALKYE